MKISEIEQVLAKLKAKFPQYEINGKSENIWIAKPAGLSRGRGIKLFSNLSEIIEYTNALANGSRSWILQKYIENPLIIENRKFDVRVWVLVTNLNPLKIWFWQKPYV